MKNSRPTANPRTLTKPEAQTVGLCLRRYLLEQLGDYANNRIHRLYGVKLVRAYSSRPKLKKLMPLAKLYGRLYADSTPMDVAVNPDTHKPCSVDQRDEILGNWLNS